MKAKFRFEPDRPFPTYAYLPGIHIHPNKPGGHSHKEEDPLIKHIDPATIQNNSDFRYALDLLNYGYYWESHVLFEAMWNAHHRKGSLADFFKALIKIAAGAIKDEMNQREAASGHFKRSLELITAIKSTEGDQFLGFSLTEMEKHLEEAILINSHNIIPLYPEWV